MKKYTTLLLDADQTLFDFKAAEKQAIKNVLKNANLPYDDATTSLYSKINDGFWKKLERGEIKREEIYVGRFKELLRALGSDIDPEIINKNYFEQLPLCSKLYDGAREFLEALGKAGYKRYMITNGAAPIQRKRIELCDVGGLFEGIFISEEVGFAKPDKAYFDAVLSEIEEKDKTKILVIGDSPTADIAGGIAAGLDTCLYSPSGNLCEPKPDYIVKTYDEIFEII